MIFLLWTFHIDGITQYVAFCAWLISLTMSLNSFVLQCNIAISFLFMYSFVWIYQILFIHSMRPLVSPEYLMDPSYVLLEKNTDGGKISHE